MPFVIDVVLGGRGRVSEDDVNDAVAAMHRDLRWADEVFSLWRNDTPIAKLGRGEIILDDCPPAVGEVLEECERYRRDTSGFFDARRPDGVIDPTGVVKTWAVMRASWRLDALGASGWMIGASGDAVVSGAAPGGGLWRMGISDPRWGGNPQDGPMVDAIDLGGANANRRALATSGIAQHGQHIWNPKTGQMHAEFAQVSVVGADLVECDAWATAIVAGGAEAALAAQVRGLEVLCMRTGSGDPGAPLVAEASPGWPSVGPPAT